MVGIRELMSTYIFDVLALSETWLSPNTSYCEVAIPGSAKLNGGGVLLYIRDIIPFTVKNELAANIRSCYGLKLTGQSVNRFWLLLHTNPQK